jgi:hypothetical protein
VGLSQPLLAQLQGHARWLLCPAKSSWEHWVGSYTALAGEQEGWSLP